MNIEKEKQNKKEKKEKRLGKRHYKFNTIYLPSM